MSGTIGLAVDLSARYSQFWDCLERLQRPVNTKVVMQFGSDRSVSRNAIVKRSLDIGSEWILFLDDDHGFRGDLLKMLIAVEQPVVGALYLQRGAPFMPVAYAEKDENGFWPLDLRNHGSNELVQVRGLGTGGMLIRSEVFRQIESPWFIHTTEKSEDLYFCDKLHEAGIPLYVHTGARMGHIAPALVWPEFDEGEDGQEGIGWCAGIAYAMSGSVVVPIDWEASDR